MLHLLVSLLSLAVIATASPAAKNAASCSPVGISSSSASAVKAAFTSSHLVPDQIPSINPKVQLNVTYGSKMVNLGNTFTTPGMSELLSL